MEQLRKFELPQPPVVALVTDFGLSDAYVSEIHVVLWRCCSSLRIVDITHLVPPGDVKSGSYVLWRASVGFPEGTIFLAIVDPGVGTDRQAVVVLSGSIVFLGPDNGILSRVVNWEGQTEVRILSSEDVGSDIRSRTFQGRDLFAPAAGKLASGVPFDHIGKLGKLKDTFPPSQPRFVGNYCEGEIVYIDRFGNLATNLPNGLKGELEIPGARILCAGITYADLPLGEPKWLPGSDGHLEIALNRGSAAERLNLKPGDGIRLRLTDGSDRNP